jgi:hypothetical protein
MITERSETGKEGKFEEVVDTGEPRTIVSFLKTHKAKNILDNSAPVCPKYGQRGSG